MGYEDVEAREARILLAMNLADYMRVADINQSELGRKIGVAQNTLSGYLSARRYPRPEILVKMADALGVTVADLTSGSVGQGKEEVVRMDPPAEYRRLSREQRQLVDQMIIMLARGMVPEPAQE